MFRDYHGWHRRRHGRHSCRRPAVLSPDLAREWLDPATPKVRAKQMVMHQGESTEVFEWFKVNMAVGNVRHQRKELIKRLISQS
ncbi:MAG: hypothetical protein JWQ69_5234 [Pseudomonas sp.]|nr:hypothetical protein [Pseudomonas sp.]